MVSTARGVTSELPLWASRACSAKSYHSTAVNRHQMRDIWLGVGVSRGGKFTINTQPNPQTPDLMSVDSYLSTAVE